MNNFEVALVKEICFVCTKTSDGPIIMNSRLTEKYAKKVKNLHNKVIGFSEKPCVACQELLKQGIALIGIDENKTEDLNNPYRTGHFAVVTEDYFNRALGETPKKRIALISSLLGLELKIFKQTIK